jgi:hypothetical protein
MRLCDVAAGKGPWLVSSSCGVSSGQRYTPALKGQAFARQIMKAEGRLIRQRCRRCLPPRWVWRASSRIKTLEDGSSSVIPDASHGSYQGRTSDR